MVAFDHLDDMHQAFLQQNFNCPQAAHRAHIVNSSEAFVQLARQGTTCWMIPHLQMEKELASGELIDLTPGYFNDGCSTGTALLLKAALRVKSLMRYSIMVTKSFVRINSS